MRFDQQLRSRNGCAMPSSQPRRLDERATVSAASSRCGFFGSVIKRAALLAAAQDQAHVVAPLCGLLEIVDPHADTSEAVILAADERRDAAPQRSASRPTCAPSSQSSVMSKHGALLRPCTASDFRHQLFAAGVVIHERGTAGGTSPSNSTSAGVRARIVGVRGEGLGLRKEPIRARSEPVVQAGAAKRAGQRHESPASARSHEENRNPPRGAHEFG